MRRRSGALGLVTLAAALVVIAGCLADPSSLETTPDTEGLPAYGLVTTQQAAEIIVALQDQPEFVLLDIRTPAEVDASHISGTTELDFYSASFRDDLSALDRELTYLIYCRTGNRTGQTMGMMDELGFDRVYDMAGGISQWLAAGYPVCIGPLDAEHRCSGEQPLIES